MRQFGTALHQNTFDDRGEFRFPDRSKRGESGEETGGREMGKRRKMTGKKKKKGMGSIEGVCIRQIRPDSGGGIMMTHMMMMIVVVVIVVTY